MWIGQQIAPKPLCGCREAADHAIETMQVAGFVVGLVAASAIDSAAFAKKQTREWAPTVAVTRGGAQLGFAATF